MTNTINNILADISKERESQDHRWGHEFDDKNTANDWSAYITRYNGNASFCTTYGQPFDGTAWRQQMVKVAALAVAAIESFDRNNGLPRRHYDIIAEP